MSHLVREGGRGQPIAANGSYTVSGNHILGFICTVSGTLSVVIKTGSPSGTTSDVTVVDAVPVTEGIYLPLPLSFPAMQDACTVTLAGGAKGTLVI
jgi:hypothetical protein